VTALRLVPFALNLKCDQKLLHNSVSQSKTKPDFFGDQYTWSCNRDGQRHADLFVDK
jgi:hypothetical protein